MEQGADNHLVVRPLFGRAKYFLPMLFLSPFSHATPLLGQLSTSPEGGYTVAYRGKRRGACRYRLFLCIAY